ncbi:hypothetical protein NDU88_004626 [Pleurodeles waltl]|uniref:Uncharacterized protein n=1 Tax=Pleurodeles waltl TaxID=8319 RepID=A0AAV7SJD5_PLEWA|nr:hypothetical protein NDU88_004626 [Pleurodeles waltl]
MTDPYGSQPLAQLWTLQEMEIYRPNKSNAEEMTKYHSDGYIKFLRSIRPDNMSQYSKQMRRFNVGEDCPVFDGL